MQLDRQTLKSIAVFGVAGNFAEHLCQAGEADDFEGISTLEACAPKGLFPIYLPGADNFLGVYPLSSSKICADFNRQQPLQPEPELALLCELEYDEETQDVIALSAKAFSVFNDCSLRISAEKLSIKKNWGADSAGIAQSWWPVQDFNPGSELDHYQLCCLLKRDGQVHEYGVDSPVKNYSYFYQKLMDWIKHTFNHQQNLGPLEALRPMLAQAHHPKQAIIALGATRYTDFGEQNYLQPNDIIGIYSYDTRYWSQQQILSAFTQNNALTQEKHLCGLIQTLKHQHPQNTEEPKTNP